MVASPKTEARTNGHIDISEVPAGPRMIRRTPWVSLGDEEYYPGYQIKMWTNYPWRLRDEVLSNVEERTRAALNQIVLDTRRVDEDGTEYPGWLDEEGRLFPPVTAPDNAFWTEIPQQLAVQIMDLVFRQARTLPLVQPRNPS